MTIQRIALICSLILCVIATGQVAAETESSQLLQTVIENNPDAFSDANQQVVLVTSEKAGDVLAKIYTFEKVGGEWKVEFPEMKASGGRTGFAPFDRKKEGDGHAPSGIFALERTFGYNKTAKTRMPYKQVTDRDWWIDDVESDQYNTWVTLEPSQPEYTEHNERLKRTDDLYHYAIVVEYNTTNPVPGKGSAIFIHWERSPGAETAGCIATSYDNMEALFKWLDPKKQPLIIMGNKSELSELSEVMLPSS